MGPIDAPTRAAWFTEECNGEGEPVWRAGADLHALVAFRELNLIEPWPMNGPFDVIFCRNTVIYLSEDARERVWSDMANLLAAPGYLYIGHSERLGSGEDFFMPVAPTIYQSRSNSGELD
jgi:chemotaxis protein methyltransferase CheR